MNLNYFLDVEPVITPDNIVLIKKKEQKQEKEEEKKEEKKVEIFIRKGDQREFEPVVEVNPALPKDYSDKKGQGKGVKRPAEKEPKKKDVKKAKKEKK